MLEPQAMMDDMTLEGRAFAWCAERGLSAEKHQTSLASLLIEVRTEVEAEVERLRAALEQAPNTEPFAASWWKHVAMPALRAEGEK
jgi:hypothetical protein